MIFVAPIGERYGRMVVISDAGKSKSNDRLVLCRCDCGIEKIMRLGKLRSGHSKSCGCLRTEILRKPRKHGHSTHNARHPLYTVWTSMIQRCENPSSPAYKYYGERGISVCDAWRQDFAAFLADMGERPAGLQIDRIDNEGNYEPGNCRWATRSMQVRNQRKRTPRPMLTVDVVDAIRSAVGVRQVDLAEIYGVSQHTISRIIRGRPPYEIYNG